MRGGRRSEVEESGIGAMTFEELEARQAARDMVKSVYLLFREPCVARDSGLRDQMQRAAVSVMTNVVEGF